MRRFAIKLQDNLQFVLELFRYKLYNIICNIIYNQQSIGFNYQKGKTAAFAERCF